MGGAEEGPEVGATTTTTEADACNRQLNCVIIQMQAARPGPLYKLEIVSDLVEGKENLQINCTIFSGGAREIRVPLPRVLENCEDFTTFKFGFR